MSALPARPPAPAKLPRGVSSLGIQQRHELLLVAPNGCHDFRPHANYGDGQWFCGPVSLISAAEKHPERAMWQFDVLTADNVQLRISLFGPYPTKLKGWEDFHDGNPMLVAGLVREFGRTLTLTKVLRVPDDLYGLVAPTYKSVPKVISGERLRTIIRPLLDEDALVTEAVSTLIERLGPVLTKQFAQDMQVPPEQGLASLLWHLHRPANPIDHAEVCRLVRRLCVDAIRTQAGGADATPDPAAAIPLQWFALEGLKRRLPFELSESQNAAIETIVTGLEADTPLNALLSGDVGSGKTLTYALPAVLAQQAGKRVAILSPNTPLAIQIAGEISTRFADTPVSLLTGSVADSKITEAIAHNAILVGTTSLLGAAKRHDWQADFLIIDEQQKFSLEQKAALAHPATNVLEATATCIPRTLGMLKHGGQTLIQLKGHSNKQIKTRILGTRDRDEIVERLDEAVRAGDRVFVIYPQVATGADDVRRNVIAAAERWERFWPGRIALLHGGMKDEEKRAALEAVLNDEKSVLVATSILEVGISIPRLRVGMVVSAERYGLSTLHQMRGRLAREGGAGEFILFLPFNANGFDITDAQIEMVKRLRPMEHTNDGFELAERDARQRGFGNLLDPSGTQHGKTATAFFGLTLTPRDFAAAEPAPAEAPTDDLLETA